MLLVVRVFAFVVLLLALPFVLWVAFVNLTGREGSMWFAGRPTTLGVHGGMLAAPKATPNSVVSENVAREHPAWAAPLAFTGDSHAAFARLKTILQTTERVTLITSAPDYLHAECRSKTMGFVDDFEARLDATAGVIHVRSASRLGRRDFGVNRSRIDEIRQAFEAAAKSAAT